MVNRKGFQLSFLFRSNSDSISHVCINMLKSSLYLPLPSTSSELVRISVTLITNCGTSDNACHPLCLHCPIYKIGIIIPTSDDVNDNNDSYYFFSTSHLILVTKLLIWCDYPHFKNELIKILSLGLKVHTWDLEASGLLSWDSNPGLGIPNPVSFYYTTLSLQNNEVI